MARLVIYPEFPKQIKRDYMYTVGVTQGRQQHALPVYDHTVKGTSSENPICIDNFRRFCTFSFEGEGVRVDIKVNTDFYSYSVLPSAKKFKHSFNTDTGVISVYLDNPDYFLVRLNDDDSTILSVFSDEVECWDFDEEKTIRVEGWYETEDKSGYITVTEPDTTIYIAAGAVLNARINILADNVRVIGRGAMLDPFSNIFEYDQNTAPENWFLHTRKNNVLVDGIHLIDARCFQIGFNGNGNIARNVKIVSSMMCSDGITFSAGKNNLAEHCYIYNSDNCMVFSASDTIYRDMTVGTTCCAIYAQGSPHNVLFNDIHIFRGDSKDSGIVRNIYNPTRQEQSMSIKIKNLDTVDCVIMSSLFWGSGIGTLPKTFDFENLSLKITDTSKPLLTVANKAGDVYTENYEFNLKNVSINGSMIENTSCIGRDFLQNSKNTVSYANEGNFVQLEYESTLVKYSEKSKVYIGDCRIFFETPVIVIDDAWLLPYEQLKAELNTQHSAYSVRMNGIDYVSSELLVSSGMAKAKRFEDEALYITPENDGNNILSSESEIISEYANLPSWCLCLSAYQKDRHIIYKANNYSKATYSSIIRMLNSEISKYGAGKYCICFNARADDNGKIKAIVRSLKLKKETSVIYDVTHEWTKITLDFEVDDGEQTDSTLSLRISSAQKALSVFEICDILMKKITE